MEFSDNQLMAIAFVGIIFAIGLATLVLIAVLVRRVWGWIWGSRPEAAQSHVGSGQETGSDGLGDAELIAAQILAIRSNVDAVSRQLADLERKLRDGKIPDALRKKNLDVRAATALARRSERSRL